MPRKKQFELGMEHGVMWAASYLVSAHGNATLAEYMLQESGIDPNTSGDDYDREVLKSVIETLNQKKQA